MATPTVAMRSATSLAAQSQQIPRAPDPKDHSLTPNTPEHLVPSRKDLAEFFLLGILNRVFDTSCISPWIDSIIEEEDDPPRWAIELALTTDFYQYLAWLESIPGSTAGLLPRQMLVALVQRRWLAKNLTSREVTWMVYSLLRDDWSSTGHMAGIFQFYHIYFECLDSGYSTVTEQQADQMLTQFLSHYSAYDDLVPVWIR
jgi:hypothetical protein